MKNKLLSLVIPMALSSANAFAGDWYEDWNEEVIPIYETDPIFEGWAMCTTPSGLNLARYITPATIPNVHLYWDRVYLGTGYTFNSGYIAAKGISLNDACTS